jgi:hypothetical protein
VGSFQVVEAKRELIWIKIALMSPSGGGKTYGSLRLATGMLEELKKSGNAKNGKILMGNTEGSRGRYYANEFKYDIVDIGAPHNPERYVEFIEYAVEGNYPILILDSTSHEWEGKSGCLELHQQAGGTYQSWAKVTPRHDKFIASIADSPIHIIATMRGKDQYEIDKDASGKLGVKKLGVGAKQRDGFEYEFSCTFLLDQKTNTAEAQKDNTHIFENEGAVILTENHGKKVMLWANSGEGYTPPVRNAKTVEEKSTDLKKEIVTLCTELGGSSNEKLMEIVKSKEPSGNPNKMKEEKVMKELLELLKVFKNEQKEEVK